MEEEKKEPLRIKTSGLAEEDKKEFVKLDVSTEEDFYLLAKETGSPIFEDSVDGLAFVIDAEKRMLYRLRK